MALIDDGLVTLLAMHDAFRRDLARLVDASASDQVEPEAISAYFDAFVAALNDHHHVEDDELYPQVRQAFGDDAKATLDAMAQEHADLADAIEAAQSTLAHEQFSRLRDIALHHLEHEERAAMPLIRDAADDEFMLGYFARRRAASDPARYLPWLLDDADPTIAVQLTSALPPHVLSLFAEEWQPVYQTLVDRILTDTSIED